ncbi:hypothetical protein LCGC14_1090090 [marine sediment metagenome]|uniref:AbiEi antitoxin C-terminal domain-containing protein n=1 Tax=marine sediment metagenome TaxID=412755 RepID=A0A0F9QIL9_9ZZZZ
MSYIPILKKIHFDGREFITSTEIKIYCNSLNLDYENIIRYLIRRKYFIRIFKCIFYVKFLEEIKYKTNKYSHFELISKGLELKGVRNWYFGLYTALKLNNATHEYFTIDYVISDSLYRNNPMTIYNRKFKFHKFKPSLLKFGIIKDDLKYSDLEKTILDFIYLWIYNSTPKNRILMDISDYTKNLSESKIKDYVRWYPKSVKEIIKEII